MIFALYNGFAQVETFKAIKRISTLMEKVAGYMAANDLKRCTVHQILKGEFSGTVYDVWNTDGRFYYKTRDSLKHHQIVTAPEVAVC